ncbi:hypothetical protein [Mangrovibacterium lignilyticum]|uniref:hypothetical protein n=1 Tax=Mangrovibacterium lignilyticum TaxID=2668052 RepID=UPI0013D7DCE6|nr:hypothetical protein [Mangrovibacterium lignilyticum]
MKRQIIKILSFLFLIGCNSVDYKPKYKDFANAWERENLIGKVKSLKQYKANVTDSEKGETENPIIEFNKEFTKSGYISYQEHFDNFGELQQYTRNTYDKNGFRVESITENTVMPMKTEEKAVFDTIIKKQISAHAKFNDSIKFDAFFKYDKNGNPIESMSIENGDTTIDRLEYKYDDNMNIIVKKQIQKVDSDIYEYLTEYKYNHDGNYTELSFKSDFAETKSTYEYDKKNRLLKISEYQSGEIQKETTFDKFYNKTLVRYFANGNPNREMIFEYKFDNKGNWIQNKVFVKENLETNKLIQIYIETREIQYYE